MKPSKKQMRALEIVARWGPLEDTYDSRSGLWEIRQRWQRIARSAFEDLRKNGFIELTGEHRIIICYDITPAGRAVLKEADNATD